MLFYSKQNVELICQLLKDIKEYGSLRLERLQLDLTQKMALAIGFLVMGTAVATISLCALIFLSLAAGYALASWMGSRALAMLVVAAFYAAAALVVYAKRHDWIVKPLTLFLHELFLSTKDTPDNDV
ncbi:MAG: phage holin family protein [Bacteroidales bacterium]|nr:phage holin family protein [Candidatus Equimonas faecalis]